MKNRIFFFNKTKDLKTLLERAGSGVKYVMLQDYIPDLELADFLRKEKRLEEIKPTYYAKKEEFRRLYLSFTGKLNKANHSLCWWSLNLTHRHPNSSDLSKIVWYLLALRRIINKENPSTLAVFTDNKNLFSQMKIWHEGSGTIILEDKIRQKIKIRDIANSIFPIKITLFFLRSLFYKIFSVFIRFNPGHDKSYTVIRTLFNHQSFQRDGSFRDAYFGGLTEFLKSNGKNIIFLGSVPHPFFANFKKLLQNKKEFNFILTEGAMDLSSIFKAFKDSLIRYFLPLRPVGDTVIEGLDFRFILEKTITSECKAHRFFANIISYYSAKSLISKVNVEKVMYPFENRAWEKLTILASREGKNRVKTLGYQHSSFSGALMNFYVGDEEKDIMPLPDTLVTTGPIPKKILNENFGFPESILKTGCGLRQARKPSGGTPRRERKEIKNILVAFGLTPEEYIKGLIFLNEAFKENGRVNVTVRPHPHPVIPIEKALFYVPDLRFKYRLDKNPSIEPSLEASDLVLYFSSTVGFESLMKGIPVINIDPGFYVETDPLFAMRDFKWTVNEPEKLLGAIKAIEGMADEEYGNLRKKAYDFASDYIYPVSEKYMNVFFE